ncbi:MAG: hypothetical protein EOO61_04395 [Hymenobacter sp.]|nr:MAG: hypothetical protein EOO61_04395 [Hymenobacter sp.]
MKITFLLSVLGGGLALGWHSTHAVLDPALLRRATQEYAARKGQLGNHKYLTIIDYKLDVCQPRLFVYDVKSRRIVLQARVSHALKSGIWYPADFSNELGSEKSCYGTFITQQYIYQGKFGRALRLVGVSAGINDQAEARAVVFHEDPGYQYSKGCFMTNAAVNERLVTLLQGRALVVVYK